MDMITTKLHKGAKRVSARIFSAPSYLLTEYKKGSGEKYLQAIPF
jgi:hypothetical protein